MDKAGYAAGRRLRDTDQFNFGRCRSSPHRAGLYSFVLIFLQHLKGRDQFAFDSFWPVCCRHFPSEVGSQHPLNEFRAETHTRWLRFYHFWTALFRPFEIELGLWTNHLFRPCDRDFAARRKRAVLQRIRCQFMYGALSSGGKVSVTWSKQMV